MCRLFGQISAEAESARDYLWDSDRSLMVQSFIQPRNPQKDGWGLGYFRNGAAELVKSARALCDEKPRFKKLASRVRSRVILGHIRAASNPRGLPRRRILGLANSQPFTDGRFLFAHNGTLQIPDEVALFLGPLRRRLRGVNDSEVFFWQFVKRWNARGSVPEALEDCVRETWAIWRACRARYPGKRAPFTGLNVLVADGRSLHAMCHYPYGAEGARSLFDRRRPWGRMSWCRRGKRVVVASENMDASAWRPMADAEIVSATLRPRGVAVRRRRFNPGG